MVVKLYFIFDWYMGVRAFFLPQAKFKRREKAKADETWVVTNSHFTPAAHKLATANRVVLIERERLIQLSVRVNQRKAKATV
ncbi:restriction endonuclease [Bacillus sp. JJ864]|uniref:restriction endonuclease n=1 Tax=Bacillus sp. JJ864 TaxID=3122975 RepID=UPI003F68A6C0